MIKSPKDSIQTIQLSLFVFVLGIILYSSITMLDTVGISPIKLSTATTPNTISDEITYFNNSHMRVL